MRARPLRIKILSAAFLLPLLGCVVIYIVDFNAALANKSLTRDLMGLLMFGTVSIIFMRGFWRLRRWAYGIAVAILLVGAPLYACIYVGFTEETNPQRFLQYVALMSVLPVILGIFLLLPATRKCFRQKQ